MIDMHQIERNQTAFQKAQQKNRQVLQPHLMLLSR